MKKLAKNLLTTPWLRLVIVGLAGFILFLSLSVLPGWTKNVPKIPLSDPQQQQPVKPQPPVAPFPTAPGLNNPQQFEAFADKIINKE